MVGVANAQAGYFAHAFPGLDHAPVPQGDREPPVKLPADGGDLASHYLPAVSAYLVPPPITTTS
jgi:hypothetical protein